jgi:hypothetical protein
MTSNQNMETFPTESGPGEIWVCPACGRRAYDRYKLGDTSCVLAAVLCLESSLVFDGDRLVNAQAVGRAESIEMNVTVDEAKP